MIDREKRIVNRMNMRISPMGKVNGVILIRVNLPGNSSSTYGWKDRSMSNKIRGYETREKSAPTTRNFHAFAPSISLFINQEMIPPRMLPNPTHNRGVGNVSKPSNGEEQPMIKKRKLRIKGKANQIFDTLLIISPQQKLSSLIFTSLPQLGQIEVFPILSRCAA